MSTCIANDANRKVKISGRKEKKCRMKVEKRFYLVVGRKVKYSRRAQTRQPPCSTLRSFEISQQLTGRCFFCLLSFSCIMLRQADTQSFSILFSSAFAVGRQLPTPICVFFLVFFLVTQTRTTERRHLLAGEAVRSRFQGARSHLAGRQGRD